MTHTGALQAAAQTPRVMYKCENSAGDMMFKMEPCGPGETLIWSKEAMPTETPSRAYRASPKPNSMGAPAKKSDACKRIESVGFMTPEILAIYTQNCK